MRASLCLVVAAVLTAGPARADEGRRTALADDQRAILGDWDLAPGKNPADLTMRLHFAGDTLTIDMKRGFLDLSNTVGFRLAAAGNDRFIQAGTSRWPYVLDGDTLTVTMDGLYQGKLVFARVGGKGAGKGEPTLRLTLDSKQGMVEVISLAFHPKRPSVSAAQLDTVRTWDVTTGRQVGNLTTGQQFVSRVAYSPDSTLFATSDGFTAKLWSLTARVQPTVISLGGANDIAFSPDGKTLATADSSGPIDLWDVATGQSVRRLPGAQNARCVVWSPDGKLLASAGGSKTVLLVDAAAGRIVKALEGHKDGVLSVAFSPDGKTLASSDDGGLIRLWDVAAGREVAQLDAYRDLRPMGVENVTPVRVALSPDGKTLAAASEDETVGGVRGSQVRLWDVPGRKVLFSFQGHERPIRCLAFNPDGKLLATGSADGTVKLWDLPGR